MKYTAKDAQGKEPHRKPMERFHVGTTALSTEQIAEYGEVRDGRFGDPEAYSMDRIASGRRT